MNRLIVATLLLLLFSGGALAQQRPEIGSRWESAPALEVLRLPDDRLASRASAGSWALVAGGAVLGAVVGFTAAAPDCLSGDTGCGSRPLQYTLLGSVVGAALGWALSSLAG